MNAATRLLPVREFPDRGAQWLLESPDNVRGLLRILAPDLADRIDFARIERIETTFVPDNLRKVEADLLLRAPLRAAPSRRRTGADHTQHGTTERLDSGGVKRANFGSDGV